MKILLRGYDTVAKCYWYSDKDLRFVSDGLNSDLSSCNFNIDDLERYIGLEDSQDVKVFENDIVLAEGFGPRYYLVSFIEGGFCLTRPDLEGFPIDINMLYPSTGCKIKVVGNLITSKGLLNEL